MDIQTRKNNPKIHRFSAVIMFITLAVVAIPLGTTQADHAGFALQFDGTTDLVTLSNTATIFGPGWENSKTISVWVKPTGVAPVCQFNSVAWCDVIVGDRPRWWGISRGNLNGADQLWIWNYDGSSSSPTDTIAIPYTPGEWVHIAMVHHNGILRAYKNGIEIGVTSSGTTMQPSTGALPVLHIGGVIISSSRNWTYQGEIDEVRLFNIPVSGVEISQTMFTELAGNEAGLRAYYKMSNGSGTTLTDDSGNGWNGTLLDGSGTVPPNGSPALWVISGAFDGGQTGPTSTLTATQILPTNTHTPTQEPPTATPTATVILPTETPSLTHTPLPLTETPTVTSTTPPPTLTFTPTNTLPPPTQTFTPTNTLPPPTLTDTPVVTNTPPPATPNTTLPPGDAGFALRFDGINDLVELPLTSSFFNPGWQNTKTVSLWVKPTGNAITCQNSSVASCDLIFGDRPRYWGIARGIIAGQDRVWVWNVDNSSGSTIDLIGITYIPGEWVHIALVHQNGVLQAYKNGVEVGATPSGTTTQPTLGGQPRLYIGGAINNVNRNWTFEGEIDEVRLFARALSAPEISDTLFVELFGNEPDLRAYYKMSNGSGTTLSDNSGNGLHGFLLDGASDVPPNGGPAVWVISGAFGGSSATQTPTPSLPTATQTPVPPTATSTSTFTPLPPTSTPVNTDTPMPPTATATATETQTPILPTVTETPLETATP